MFKKIEKPATRKVRSVIRFLNARNMKPAEIHRQLCEVYVHDDLRSGRPSVVNEDLVGAVEEKIQGNR
jgi:hypothetical protein